MMINKVCRLTHMIYLRFHRRQRLRIIGSWDEQRRCRVHERSFSPEERIESLGKAIWLCCHHEMVQRLRRDLSRSIWIRWHHCWSFENHFTMEVTHYFRILTLGCTREDTNLFQFFETKLYDNFIFHKHSGLIQHQFPLFCDFLRKWWNPRWRL